MSVCVTVFVRLGKNWEKSASPIFIKQTPRSFWEAAFQCIVLKSSCRRLIKWNYTAGKWTPKGQVFLSLLYTAQSQGHRTLHSTEETFKKYVIELNLIEIVQFLLLPFWKKLLQLGKVISKLKTQQPIFITKQKINLPMEHKIYVIRINMCCFFFWLLFKLESLRGKLNLITNVKTHKY